MRKFFVFLLAALMLTGFTGCKGGGSRPEDKLLVTALGFDFDGKLYTVTAETVKAQSGENSISALSEKGENLKTAFLSLGAKSPSPLSFSHTAAVIFGEGVTLAAAEQIRLLLTEPEQIPLSAVTLSAENATELISGYQSGEPMGLLLQSLLRQKSGNTGLGGNTAFFEIATALIQPVKLFALPRVFSEGEEFIIGELYFVGEGFGRPLTYEESLTYTVVRNIFEGGSVISGGEAVSVLKTELSLKPRLTDGRLRLDFTLRTKQNGEAVAEILRECISESKEDIFGICAEIYKTDKELFSTVSYDYEKYYREKSVEIKVEE